ncbi:ubiquitin-protein ligase, putative [Plasmodium malariae]|uniref:Ubiquitin-protein ligase, putative n=1 Tax=Plasmodium malariae TaxID=5858 RepID=A0A1C3L1M6_PLAMA|nr:ubiquitin-protein ligase, putative [Plasmodium malariae]
MYNTSSYFKSFPIVLFIISLILLRQNCVCTHDYSENSNKKIDHFVEAYDLLDKGEYEKSFSNLKSCVHYDIRCLTLSGVFYYLGLNPVKRDVCNALYIWKVCSDYGSSDAQFYLAVMYSNYFSLPNLYSYYVEEDEIEQNIILFRMYLLLRAKYLERSIADGLHQKSGKYEEQVEGKVEKGEGKNEGKKGGKKEGKHTQGVEAEGEAEVEAEGEAEVEEEDARNFRNVPMISFTQNNELVLKIKNIRYNTDELKVYFKNLDNFPKNDFYVKKGRKINYSRNHNLSLLYYYSSSIANHPGSILALGVRYMNGYGVEKDCDTAARYYLRLIKEIFNSGEKTEFEIVDLMRLNVPYYDRYNMNNKRIKNIEIFLESSLHDNHRIITMIARRYLMGIDGVEKNYKKAHDYLIKAAKYNNSEAISLLGYIYMLGLGVKINYNKAAEYFIRGNKLNDSLSFNGLGYMHFFGLGNFKKNPNLAFYYFELSAKNNLSSAQFNLACLYLSGVGAAQSFQNAFYWFYKSLNNGNLLAAYVIGYMHYNGIITARNCKLALSLLAKVAENHVFILNTTNRIIRYTEKGRIREALFLMALLAETGSVQSQINLSYKINNHDFAFFLPTNDKCKKVYASRYLAMASENNDFKSLYTLGDYAYKGYGLYIRIFPKNNLPINSLYDINHSEYLYTHAGIGQRSGLKNGVKNGEKSGTKSGTQSNAKNIARISARTSDGFSGVVKTNKIISTDFVDEAGIIFNDKWKFHFGFKFSFNEVDYQLAYHHYKSIISYYPNNFYVIQALSRACYNLGFMHYYGIGVSKNIEKALIYFNSSIKIYPTNKVPSVLFVLYIKLNKHLYNFKKKIKDFKKILFF